MVGPVSQRITSGAGLHQDDCHGENHGWLTQPQTAVPCGPHSRQLQTKQYSGGDSGKRVNQRVSKGADPRVGGGLDMNGRINLPSSASSSGRLFCPSNIDRFLEVTTPRVKTQNLPKSYVRDSSHKRCLDPEETAYFNLGDLWDSFDEWSAYGAGVPLVLNGDESVVQYYVPYLSALQLYKLSSRQSGFRNRESDFDTGSEASSDGENDNFSRVYEGAESPPSNLRGPSGNSIRPKYSRSDNDEDEEVWSYFETISPYSRVPLVDKIADLSRDFQRLRTLKSCDLLPNSWLSVAWYPIYRIPTGPTLRDLDACFLTFHPLSTPLKATGDASMRSPHREGVCVVQNVPLSETLSLRAFGLASYKLRGAVWSSSPERRQVTMLQKMADDHLKRLHVQHLHSDFIYFTTHSAPTRR